MRLAQLLNMDGTIAPATATVDVRTQRDLERALASVGESVVRVVGSGAFEIAGDHHIQVAGDVRIRVGGRMIVDACEQSVVYAHEQTVVSLRDFAAGEAEDEVQLCAMDCSHAYGSGQSMIEATGASVVGVCDNALLCAYGSAHGVVRGLARALARDTTHIEAHDCTQVMACGSAFVAGYDRSVSVLREQATGVAEGDAQLVVMSAPGHACKATERTGRVRLVAV